MTSAPSRLLAAAALALACITVSPIAQADMTWHWRYSGADVTASGDLVTADTPNSSGFYQIISISGSRNSEAITGLYPSGSAIPGNESYAVDNLIRLDRAGQITVEGFAYTLASGAHANPFYADSRSPTFYAEVFTRGTRVKEVSVTFSAAPVPQH